MTPIFFIFLLLPSVALALAILATFYGINRAYYGVTWVPLALFGVLVVFQRLLDFQQLPDSWPGAAFLALGWTSMLQALFGLVLTVRAYYQRESVVGMAIAAGLVSIPFFFRI
jgi:hypothetical protein